MEFVVKNKIKIVAPEVSIGCGVADYSDVLAKNLVKIGLNAEVVYVDKWVLKSLFKLIKKISLKKYEILHIQYPSQPYGKNILVNLLGIIYFKRFVFTLHEYSEAHTIRKIASLILCFCAKEIIFTNENEKKIVTKKWLISKQNAYLINIGSNIPFSNYNSKPTIGSTVVFFGLIRPKKGLEEFLNFANICNNKKLKLTFIIVGSKQSGNDTYYQSMIQKINALNINLYLEQPARKVGEILATSNFTYLHYPDGVSERRGSFVAALGNNSIILSNKGINTSIKLYKTFIDCQTPYEAYLAIEKILKGGSIDIDQSCINDYLQDKNWDHIAELHKKVYGNF